MSPAWASLTIDSRTRPLASWGLAVASVLATRGSLNPIRGVDVSRSERDDVPRLGPTSVLFQSNERESKKGAPIDQYQEARAFPMSGGLRKSMNFHDVLLTAVGPCIPPKHSVSRL